MMVRARVAGSKPILRVVRRITFTADLRPLPLILGTMGMSLESGVSQFDFELHSLGDSVGQARPPGRAVEGWARGCEWRNAHLALVRVLTRRQFPHRNCLHRPPRESCRRQREPHGS
jgi:hypothetical protein